MIKFFRHIRLALLNQNRFGKYLLYALGEVFLVVIGILIALYINNANEFKSQRQKELALLTEMSKNLQNDLKDLDYNIKGSAERISANEVILKALQERIPMNDSLKPHYGNIHGNFQFSSNTSAWENLKSVGMDLISNDSLKNNISNLYSTRYSYIDNVTQRVDDRFQWETFYPQFLDQIDVDQFWVAAAPLNHTALMDNHKFHETLKMNLFIRHFMLDLYSKAQKDVNSLLSDIESHIQTLEK